MERCYIKDKGKCQENEINNLCTKYCTASFTVLAIYSDRVECTEFKAINDIEHLLEIRAFSESSELKAIRTALGNAFVWRFADDSILTETQTAENTWTEYHYLDIDKKLSKGCEYVTTGGGKYTLPTENAQGVEIKNYLDFNDDGIVKIVDFRIVKLLKKGEMSHGKEKNQ